jgi:hypothetical protein
MTCRNPAMTAASIQPLLLRIDDFPVHSTVKI